MFTFTAHMLIFLCKFKSSVTLTAECFWIFLFKSNRGGTKYNYSIFSKHFGKMHFMLLLSVWNIWRSYKIFILPSCIFILYCNHGHAAENSHGVGLRHKQGFVLFHVVVQWNADWYFKGNASKYSREAEE